MEFMPSPNWEEGILTPLKDQGSTDTDDNPLVSGLIAPATMPIELHLLGAGKKASQKP